jgi:hypothetical protein
MNSGNNSAASPKHGCNSQVSLVEGLHEAQTESFSTCCILAANNVNCVINCHQLNGKTSSPQIWNLAFVLVIYNLLDNYVAAKLFLLGHFYNKEHPDGRFLPLNKKALKIPGAFSTFLFPRGSSSPCF